MSEAKPELKWWLAGLAAFAVVVALSLSVTKSPEVSLGIAEHQKAATAERVNEIQEMWRDNNVRGLAIIAMVGDLIFIGIFGWGTWRAGRSFMRMEREALRVIGQCIATAAIVFLVTDYTETLLQLVQLLQDRGSNLIADTAASVRPVKVGFFLVSFYGVILALVVRRFSAARA